MGNKVRRGDIRHAVVVRTVKNYQRKDGVAARFDDNACVLINKAGDPVGTRVTGKGLFFFEAIGFPQLALLSTRRYGGAEGLPHKGEWCLGY